MKDIRIQPQDAKRLKPPSIKQSHKDLLGNSPYDIGLSVDVVKVTKKMNRMLHDEKKEFMAKLNITRFIRSKLENDASTKIQAIYRGYYVRKNFGEVRHNASTNAMIRANLRSFLDHRGYMAVGLGQFTKERNSLRRYSATLIQCTFRRLLSRKCLRRLQFDRRMHLKVQAAVVIQARTRGITARARVRSLIEKRRIILYRLSAIKIQAALRGLLGRRRVHRRRYRLRFLASRMIQTWYRAKYSRRIATHIKNMLQVRKTNHGALQMQLIVRRFLAIRRMARIRLRKLHVLIFTWVTRIQCLVRKFLARVSVGKKLREKREKAAATLRQTESDLRQAAATQAQAEALELLESADIFVQAERNNVVGVEDIFKGLMGGEPHNITDMDSAGNTLLCIAARAGNTDLLRKCILWGFDINHHNNDGHSSLMLAARHNQLAAFQYLLSFAPPAASASGESAKLQNAGSGEKPLMYLSTEDIGYLLVTAAANAAIADLTMLQALLLHGFDVNTASNMGMTAMHAACQIGHSDAFKLLVKFKAKIDCVDDQGQTPLHKACETSPQLMQWILGLDPDFNTYMSDQTRLASVLAVDADGKDCMLHAALAGQSEIVQLLDGITNQAGAGASSKKHRPGSAGSEEISWSAQDITKAVQLVISGNLFCLQRVLDSGYDIDWQEESGQSMALAACAQADVDMINILLDRGANFSLVDHQGRNCMHLIAANKVRASELMVHLFTHAAGAKCQVIRGLLVGVDSVGDTPFHYAAKSGTEIHIDLLVAEIFPAVLNVRNRVGMTPLLIACSHNHDKMIMSYLKLGADALIIDDEDHGCIWHVFHPCDAVSPLRRPWCSEYLVAVSSSSSQSRKDKDDETARLVLEASVVTALLKAGCSLYSDYGRGPAEMMQIPFKASAVPTSAADPTTEPGDILLHEQATVLFKTIVPSVVSPLDAWRLFISSIRFDDGSLRLMLHLLRLGILEVIAPEHEMSEEQSLAATAATFTKPVEHNTLSRPRTNTRSSAVSPLLAARAQSMAAMDSYQLNRLNDVFFIDLNAVGWIIHLHNANALLHFMKRGYDVALPVDSEGNSALHCIAANGTAEMVDIVVSDKRVRFEQLNLIGQTAGMIAAKNGNFKCAKRLFELRASARKSLEGKYAAWVLAFARKYEKNEKNLQCGRVGDDDAKYFDTSPDPFHSTWYNG